MLVVGTSLCPTGWLLCSNVDAMLIVGYHSDVCQTLVTVTLVVWVLFLVFHKTR